MSKELDIRKECCDIWNKLKDKTKMIDYLIESKKQLADLEVKLAEKENELEEVKQHRTQILNFGKRTKKVVIANPYGEDCIVYNQEDQDKIEFAIERLEKVKKNIKKCNYKDFGIMYQSDAIAVIDNQINELKDGKIK